MPTLRSPPDDTAPEWPARSLHHLPAVGTHIYVAILLLPLLVVVRTLVSRWRISQRSDSGLETRAKHRHSKHAPGPASEKDHRPPRSNSRADYEQHRPHLGCGRQFQPLRTLPGQLRSLDKVPAMDGADGGLEEDHYPWSALAASRGVSTGDQNQQHDPSLTRAVTGTEGASGSPRPRTLSRGSSTRRLSGSSDELDGEEPKAKGDRPMAGHAGSPGRSLVPELDVEARLSAVQLGDSQLRPSSLSDAAYPGVDVTTVPRHFTRPPPPPPLTPPTLSTAVFPFEDRRPTYAASIPPALDLSFIHQPNPEYGAEASSSATTSADVRSASPHSATTTDGPFPRRRSYTRSVPIGILGSRAAPGGGSGSNTTTAAGAFSPSSYPPTSPLLPPPPPTSSSPPPPSSSSSSHHQQQQPPRRRTPPSAPPSYEFVGGPGGPGIPLLEEWEPSPAATEAGDGEEISLQGEIISVVDGAGHGWTRHTRVYGGGVCLACLAAARRDAGAGAGSEGVGRGGGGGGFYGDRVPLEDRR